MKEQSIHESSCCRRFSLNLSTWPHWTLRPWPSTFAELRNTGVQCSDSVFQTLLGKMLVKARNWVCWQRENNCSRKAIFISRTCFLCILSTHGFHVTVVMYSFILSLVYIQFEILLHSLQALGAETSYHFPLLFWGWAKQTHLFLPERLAGDIGVTDTTGVYTLL